MTLDPTGPRPGLARQALTDLRPQAYGSGNPNAVPDPLIEPLWTGLRALAAVDAAGADLVDGEGNVIIGMEAILDGLEAALDTTDLVIDGWITKQATRTADALTPFPDEMPTMGSLLGLRRNRAVDSTKLKDASVESITFDDPSQIAFVATDLLWLDETPILDVPLLERRRLLESVLIESDVVRLGPAVRAPIGTWIGSWRTQGFEGLTYKAANSRYLPGVANPDWVISGMPRR